MIGKLKLGRRPPRSHGPPYRSKKSLGEIPQNQLYRQQVFGVRWQTKVFPANGVNTGRFYSFLHLVLKFSRKLSQFCIICSTLGGIISKFQNFRSFSEKCTFIRCACVPMHLCGRFGVLGYVYSRTSIEYVCAYVYHVHVRVRARVCACNCVVVYHLYLNYPQIKLTHSFASLFSRWDVQNENIQCGTWTCVPISLEKAFVLLLLF